MVFSPSTPIAIPLYPRCSNHVLDHDEEEEDVFMSGGGGCDVFTNDADQVFDDLSQCEDVGSCQPLSSNKRKNSQTDGNDELQKPAKRKKYRPRVVSQFPKTSKKSQPESNNTPKPATPKQRRSYVKKTSACKRSLFVDDGDSISFPFLENFNNSKDEQDEIENSTITNESAIVYNSLQSYQKKASLSCLCLVESRRVGRNFPITRKRKRVRRKKTPLVNLLTPFAKGRRSKSFIRKGKCWTDFCVDGSSTTSRKMKQIIKRIISVKKNKHRKVNKRYVRKKSGELVLYKPKGPKGEVILDQETLRVWNLLVAGKGNDEHNQSDEQKQYWIQTRAYLLEMIDLFLSRMHIIQGDRRFLPWKGSVLDSVVGVFLTQNVTDRLSSNAFMTLAARYPVKSVSCEQSSNVVSSIEESEAKEAIASSKFDNNGAENNSCSIESNSDSSEVSHEGTNDSDPKFDKGMKDGSDEETETQKANTSSKVDDMEKNSDSPGMNFGEKQTPNTAKTKKQTPNAAKTKKEEQMNILMEKKRQHWDELRKRNTEIHRHRDCEDSIDYKAVKSVEYDVVADAIKNRGQQNIIAQKIQAALMKITGSDGRMDLEWLKKIPPKEVKEYLLDIYGLGLKSVECIRLLSPLKHDAFPVDVNVARIVVRLGWVPLQPLPESIQIHNLEIFPNSDKIQQFLWPRLCTLDRHKLYELHYHLITFGKIFCTKRTPNCNVCPMRSNCKHYQSSLTRTKLALPPQTTTDQAIVVTEMDHANAYSFPSSDLLTSTFIERERKECEPIVDMPASPKPESPELDDFDSELEEEIYEDEDIEDIPTVYLSSQESSCLPKMLDNSYEEFDYGMNTSTAVVATHPDAANVPLLKMKKVSRLKTERLVYVLTDNHPLLAQCTPREPDDPSPYLLIVWLPAEFESSGETSKTGLQEKENSQTVPGTLLIPCRTAMRARFPLNGTYFQVNEVFADYASMRRPINVPRNWVWNLERRITYFGTTMSSITKGLSLEEIRQVCCEGFICTRAIDTITGAPRPISSILHRNTTAKVGKKNKNASPNES